MPTKIEVPDDLAALFSDPEWLRKAVGVVNALLTMEKHLVVPGADVDCAPGKPALKGEPPNLIFPLPFKAPNTWAAATGTATRTTFATGSVTLPQLAERVKALEDDLIAVKILPTA